MKVLLIKMSSMGDVIHALPAVTDLSKARPDVSLDWVVEEGFESIPALHPFVEQVLPIALRRWRGAPASFAGNFSRFLGLLRAQEYDLVIDAQGLLKSALVAAFARGSSVGLSWRSAREPLASVFYGTTVEVVKGEHAIGRLRKLFGRAFGYTPDDALLDYGVPRPAGEMAARILLLHGTTWPSKHWPEAYWQELAGLIIADGYEVVVPHGNEVELARAQRIGEAGARVLARMGVEKLFEEMALSTGIVSVDSGLGHLAAAVGVPLVGLYGPTDPRLTGPAGMHQSVIASDHLHCIPCLKRDCEWPVADIYPPCFAESTPEDVWRALKSNIGMAAR